MKSILVTNIRARTSIYGLCSFIYYRLIPTDLSYYRPICWWNTNHNHSDVLSSADKYQNRFYSCRRKIVTVPGIEPMICDIPAYSLNHYGIIFLAQVRPGPIGHTLGQVQTEHERFFRTKSGPTRKHIFNPSPGRQKKKFLIDIYLTDKS